MHLCCGFPAMSPSSVCCQEMVDRSSDAHQEFRRSFAEYVVSVERPAGQTLGLRMISSVPQLSGVVVSVEKGGVLSGTQIRRGDRLLAVNGTSGSFETMLALLKEEGLLELQFRRPVEFQVTAQRAPGKDLGISMSYSKHDHLLLITGITEGAIADWNAANHSTGLDVRANDCIISVNGMKDDAVKMLEETKLALSVDLSLVRYFKQGELSLLASGR
mmetsp:Transcript_15863/g.43644  ORF Transcript_15863/g.43644 Transcript_15863/m.43644 type:complete len:217 (-) Transcript_15863:151-801(-)